MRLPRAAGAQTDGSHDADVLVVGSCLVDLVLRAPRLPMPGESVVASELAWSVGGKGVNQAIGVARLGARARLAARVGDDRWGAVALERLVAEAVDVHAVVRDPDAPTGTCVVLVGAGGENVTVAAPGASARLAPADVEAALAAPAAVVLAHLNAPVATLEGALAGAREAGATTVLNASPLGTLPEPLVGLADVLVVSASEAAALAGAPVVDAESAADAAAVLLARGCGAALVTLGARGVLLATLAERHVVRAPAAEAVDTTGAGDAFVAALGVALARRARLVEGVRFAVAAASLAVRTRGTWAAMPRRADVERLLALEAARAAGTR